MSSEFNPSTLLEPRSWSDGQPELSVVLPAYQEAGVLPSLLPRLLVALRGLGVEWEVVIVDDGSTDGTWSVVEGAARADGRVRGVRLSRNFGHQAALSAGLSIARGGAVITMDSDLQHPPEVIPALLAKAREGNDVVYAVRSSFDSAGWFKRRSASLFYRLLNRMTALDLPEGADRKSIRLNSSHQIISYAVFCLKKKIVLLTSSSDSRC